MEAAREAGMAAVVVAGRTPMYELSAADLIVRQLSELSFVNLKQLFRNEELASNQVWRLVRVLSNAKHHSARFDSSSLHT